MLEIGEDPVDLLRVGYFFFVHHKAQLAFFRGLHFDRSSFKRDHADRPVLFLFFLHVFIVARDEKKIVPFNAYDS